MPESAVPTKVVLVGLMGSGKTTVGKKVAKLVGWRFADGDVELVQRSGRTVAEWFEQVGEDGFRSAETELLDDLLGQEAPTVIGAGGGVVVRPRNRERLAQPDVFVVYLHGEPEFLASRAKPKPHRPLLAGDPSEVLRAMYDVRDPWYREAADAVVEVRPAHEAGEKPKWRLAESVVESLIDAGVVDASALAPVEPKP